MAFNTKLNLSCAKFYQGDGTPLFLSGDTKIDAIGTLCYTSDQSATYVARSMVDAGYVTGKTSHLQCEINALSGTSAVAITGVTNGLTKVGAHSACLGGALVASTTVSLSGTQTLKLGSANTFDCIGTGSTVNSSSAGNCVSTLGVTPVAVQAQAADAVSGKFATFNANVSASPYVCLNAFCNSTSCCGQICLTPNAITVNGGATFPGVQYSANFAPNFTARSLVDAAYVTGKTSTGLTTANNGLCKQGQNVRLGGALTGNTTISSVSAALNFNLGNRFNVTGTSGYNFYVGGTCKASITTTAVGSGSMQFCAAGIGTCMGGAAAVFDYCADYSACPSFNARTIVDAGYVTGRTCGIACKANKNIATVGEVIYRDATQITGCTNMIYCDSIHSFGFGRNSAAVGADSSVFGGNNNTAGADCSAVLGGQGGFIDSGNLRSAIIGGNNINLSGTTYIDTVAVDCLAIFCPPAAGTGDVLTYNPVTKKIMKTTLSSLGGLTGATNGLHTSGQDVKWGGNLTECTHIEGAFCWDVDAVRGFNLRTSGNTDINIDAQNCGGFLMKSQCGSVDTFPDFTQAIGIYGNIDQPNGFAICDNRAGTGQTGIVYGANYSINYVPRSLVDKQYVDSVATGLNVHAAVRLATTTSIILSGNQLIDGFLTVNGDRILVKNQGTGTTGATTNGIYIASASTWSRASDYDGAPSGEVSNGDLIPVTSGNTQNNTLWAQTALNPITVGSTPLIFSLFATNIDVQAGNGIDVTMVGGVHTVSVQLASNCGLTFCGTGLAVNPTIAGTALSYTTGVLDVNAASGGVASSIPVRYNAGDCLVINCADINSVANSITGATNGLTRSGKNVVLGGNLTGNTTINGTSTHGLTLSNFTQYALSFNDADITDNSGTPSGLTYTANYGATFVDRSLVDKFFVNNRITGGTTILTANNGLTKTGTTVQLGGALHSGTTVVNAVFGSITELDLGYSNILNYFGGKLALKRDCVTAGNNFAIIGARSDASNESIINTVATTGIAMCSCIAGVGHGVSLGNNAMLYGADYTTDFVDNSLITKKYVCSQTSGITANAITSAANGLTKVAQQVRLGGTLTGNTGICISAGALCLSDTNNAYNFSNAGVSLGSFGSCVTIATSGADLKLVSCYGKCVSLGNNALLYGADYSSSFIARSIPDAAWVTGKTSTAGVQTVNNGLTKFGTNAVLGGNLTGNTKIDVCNFTLKFNNGQVISSGATGQGFDSYNAYKLSGQTFLSAPGRNFVRGNLGIGCQAVNPATTGCLNIGVGNTSLLALTTGCNNVAVGNSALFTLCTGKNNIALGTQALYGTTTGCANIAAGFNALAGVSTGCYNVSIGHSSLSNVIAGNCNTAVGTCALYCNNSSGNVALGYCAGFFETTNDKLYIANSATQHPLIYGDFDIPKAIIYGQFATSGATCLLVAPAAGVPLVDAVLVRNAGTGEIKTVAGSALGDKNNFYSTTAVTVSVTLVTGSSYVILVDHVAPVTITLPLTPKDGEAFKIKDISANALTNNITIDGNGKDIDGSPTGLINTDYGALELVYYAGTTEWFSLAFVN